jgi:superfamily II DNA or RNA helicase
MTYQDFISAKQFRMQQSGFTAKLDKYPLMDYQSAITEWALRRGRAAIFADTGLGKTIMQLVWAAEVAEYTGGKVLILAPLAVSSQTREEASKFGIPCCDIINYEQLHNINTDDYVGVVLDESSILKGFDGRIRRQITESFKNTPYKLSCTATPSPNDFMELGTQSVMTLWS